MSISTRQGAPQFPTIAGSIPASTHEAMDAAIQVLQGQKNAWVSFTIRERIALIDELVKDFFAVSQRWVSISQSVKGITETAAGEDWLAGVLPVLKNLRQLRQSLQDIETGGQPKIPGTVKTLPNGQVVAPVFPLTTYDSIFFTGLTAEIWMEPGVTAEELPQTQAVMYRDTAHEGKVALVLGAGNVPSIGPMDIFYKLFVEDHVVIIKMNPVNAYTGPLIEEAFHTLIDKGFLRVVYGGAAEGAYLCNHTGVDEIHITGSDKTFDAIVFGTGAEGATRKAQNHPTLTKPITGELGNVSPVIVVPGPWNTGDLAFQAEHIVSMLTNNAGFNCNATRVVITHEEWAQRGQLLQQTRAILQQVPTRASYYPGAQDRQKLFVAKHPDAEQIGTANERELPWTFIANVNAQDTEDVCFTTEAFCGLFAETALSAASVVEYIEKAVAFANESLWGTLNATILVHPTSLKDPAIAAAVESAIANLRYGSIGLNYWAGTSFALCSTTWGAFPGHPINDIQSGNGVVHNTLMFSRPQKSVLRAPFRSSPTPPWFATKSKTAAKVFPKIVDLEANPAPWKVPGILFTAITG